MKTKISLILVLCFVSTSVSKPRITTKRLFENLEECGRSKVSDLVRVVGGSEASAGQFPWQVSLQRQSGGLWFHICGAVVLNQNWILTAAHCINGLPESALRAVVGQHLLEEDAVGLPIDKLVKHEAYSPSSLANDLALLKLKTPIDFTDPDSDVNSVCLPLGGQKFTQYVSVSGWGTTSIGGQTPSNQLMFANDVPIISLSKCRSIYGFNAIREGMLCAGAPKGNTKGLCQGDSGGPLIQVNPEGQAVLVGISSFNRECASKDGIPDVFVEISYYRDWIDTNATD